MLAKRAYQVMAPMIPIRLRKALQRMLLRTPAAEVIRILDALDRAGVRATVFGGWGIDALVGEQTRRHRDLDLIVSEGEQMSLTKDVMSSLGYRWLHDEVVSNTLFAQRSVWQDDLGHTIDLHPFSADYDGTHDQSSAEGLILGRCVRCVTPEMQLFLRKNRVRDEDCRDVARLCSEFRLPLPSGYSAAADEGVRVAAKSKRE